MRRIYQHVKSGHPIIVFPALKPAKYKPGSNLVIDRKWDLDIIRLIKAIDIPVLPVFVNNHNSLMFHVLGIIHPVFQAMVLDNELKKKQNQKILIRIGKPISHNILESFDAETASRYLRARTYALGTTIEINRFRFFPVRKRVKDRERSRAYY